MCMNLHLEILSFRFTFASLEHGLQLSIILQQFSSRLEIRQNKFPLLQDPRRIVPSANTSEILLPQTIFQTVIERTVTARMVLQMQSGNLNLPTKVLVENLT